MDKLIVNLEVIKIQGKHKEKLLAFYNSPLERLRKTTKFIFDFKKEFPETFRIRQKGRKRDG